MTDITFGDKMGSKVMTLKPFSEQENYIVVAIQSISYKVFQEYISLVSLSIWPFVSLFICPPVRSFVYF